MQKYAKNVLNLRDYQRFPYPWFNPFDHKGPATTNPIAQLEVMDYVQDHIEDLDRISKLLLLKIIRETCRRGQYYTFMSHKKFAEYLDCSERSVRTAIQELRDKGWVYTTKSKSYPYHLITDFNVGKTMPLGTKGRETVQSKGSTGNNCRYNKKNKDTSKEVSNTPKTRRINYKPKNSLASLERTWVKAWNNSQYGQDNYLRTLGNDKNKFSSLIGRIENADSGSFERTKGLWTGEIKDLHEMITWSVRYWEHITNSFTWLEKTPTSPDVGWFVRFRVPIFDLWMKDKLEDIPEDLLFTEEAIRSKPVRPEEDSKYTNWTYTGPDSLYRKK